MKGFFKKRTEKADAVIRIEENRPADRAQEFMRYRQPRKGAHRQCVCPSRETHGRLSRIVRSPGGDGSMTGGYVITPQPL